MEPTEWAYRTEKFITHAVYILFALLHFGNLIFGTILLFPMFSLSELHLEEVNYPTSNYQVCYPPLFWFTFMSLLVEYSVLIIFILSFSLIVPKEVYKFQQDLDRSN